MLLSLIFLLTRCQSKDTSGNEITVDEVYTIISDSTKVNDYVLLDTRARMDFVRGHLVSAFLLSQDSIESKISIILKESRPLILYDSGGRLQKSKVVNILLANGVTNFHVMAGGFSEWTKRGYPAAIQLVRNTSDKIPIQRKDISAREVYEVLTRDQEYVVIDIRSYPAFEELHIKSARSIPYVPVNEFVVTVEDQNFARNRPIILYGDADDDISEKAAEVMLRNDFSRVYLLKGGIEEWTLKDYPIEYRSRDPK